MPSRGDVVARLRQGAPAGLLLAALAAAWLASSAAGLSLRLASPDRSHVDQLRLAIGDLTPGALVLVAVDADLGTYPEIRAATRAALSDLLAHGALLAIVSFTPEGRAIAVAERDRMAREGAAPPVDLGWVAGSEAGMVRGIAGIVPEAATGPVAEAIRRRGGGIGAFDAVLTVSGSDISARSWVEQVGSRLPELPIMAIAPTFLDPELEPYLRSGQLAALLATMREGIAYAEAVDAGSRPVGGSAPAPLPMLVGMLVAIAVLAEAGLRRLAGGLAVPTLRRGPS